MPQFNFDEKVLVGTLIASGADRNDVFHQTISNLLDSDWMEIHISRLGLPHWTTQIPTAAVAMTGWGKVSLIWNPEFYDKHTIGQLRFIAVHELFHIECLHRERGEGYDHDIFNIACDVVINELLIAWGLLPDLDFLLLKRVCGNKECTAFEQVVRKFHTSAEYMADMKPGPCAVCSKPLHDEGGWTIDKVMPELFEPVSKLRLPAAEIQARTAYTAEQIYDILLERHPEWTHNSLAFDAPIEALAASISEAVARAAHAAGMPMPGSEGEGEGEGEGEEEGESTSSGSSNRKSEKKIGDTEREIRSMARGMQGEVKDLLKKIVKSFGHGGDGMAELTQVEPGQPPKSPGWMKIVTDFSALHMSRREKLQWIHPNRRLAAMPYGKVLLPCIDDTSVKVPKVKVFGDVSGSMYHLIPTITANLRQILEELVDDYRGACEVEFYTFDDYVYTCPASYLKDGKLPMKTGGTNFQEVANFVEGKNPSADYNREIPPAVCYDHPDVVIMVTDGQCSIPKIERPDNWLWMIYGGGASSHYSVGTSTPNVGKVIVAEA